MKTDGARMSAKYISWIAIWAVSLNGCNQKAERAAPPTYPVKGTVKGSTGAIPAGGCVEFKPRENESELTATGVIQANGEFSLSIPFVDRVIPGATAGAHRVYVVMPLGANRMGGDYVPIEGELVVKEGSNEFAITLPGR